MALINRGKSVHLLLVLLGWSVQTLADFAPDTSLAGTSIYARSPTEPTMMNSPASDTAIDSGSFQASRPGHFDNEIAAVVAASDVYNPLSIAEDREYMGAILFGGGYYTYTAEAGETGRDQITVRIKVPGGSRIVAFWHTHGAAGADRSYFSEVDTELARQWNLPFYLADYTGTLKVYEAGDKLLSLRKAKRLGLPARNGFSRGRRIEHKGGQLVRIATRLHTPPAQKASKGGELMAHNNFQFAYM